MKRLNDIVYEASAKGLRDQELVELERVWVDACVRYELEARPPEPGIAGAITWIDNKFLVAYAAASRYVTRVIDEIQRGERK